MSSVKTILVVGTVDARRARLLDILSQARHGASDVASTDEALARIAAELPPLVIMDVARANEVGTTVCRRIKAFSPNTFILQIAREVDDGWPTGADPSIDIDASIDAYLIEPIQPAEVLAMVRSLLRLQKVEADLRDSEHRLALAQDSAGLAILDWMIADNRFVHSANFLALFDLPERAPDTPLEPMHLLERIHPDDLGGLVSEFADGTQTARSFDKEFRITRRDGTIRWIASRGRFFIGPGGTPERMLSLNSDVTERKTAERANAELASIVATSVDAILSVDLVGDVTSWNAGAERLFAIPAATMLGKPLDSAFGEFPASEKEEYQRRLADGEAHDFELQPKRTDGSPLDIWATSAPMRERDGRVIGSSFIIRDMSSQRQREDHVRFLMRELTHRSKNLLAVIQAMARQSVTKGITQEEFVLRFNQRLAGLAGSHDLLSSVNWHGASLMELIRSQLNHYIELFGVRIILDGEDIALKPEAAQNVGIALHELSTNAAKYGALSNEDGLVTIAWRIANETGNPSFTLRWRESGGPPVVAPQRKGFGSIVMDRIAGRALGGKSGVTFEPAGVIWVMEVPRRGGSQRRVKDTRHSGAPKANPESVASRQTW